MPMHKFGGSYRKRKEKHLKKRGARFLETKKSGLEATRETARSIAEAKDNSSREKAIRNAESFFLSNNCPDQARAIKAELSSITDLRTFRTKGPTVFKQLVKKAKNA